MIVVGLWWRASCSPYRSHDSHDSHDSRPSTGCGHQGVDIGREPGGSGEQSDIPMIQIASRDLTHLLQTYGYLAVFVFVAVESTGIPFPGETMLLAAAIYAGATHQLAIAGVIAAAA